jgi:hypothetical protein
MAAIWPRGVIILFHNSGSAPTNKGKEFGSPSRTFEDVDPVVVARMPLYLYSSDFEPDVRNPGIFEQMTAKDESPELYVNAESQIIVAPDVLPQ